MKATALLGALLAAAPVLGDDGRGFIGFVQQGELPWRSLAVPDLPEGLRARVLSESPGGGPVAMVVSHPAGWTRPRGYYEQDLAAGPRRDIP